MINAGRDGYRHDFARRAEPDRDGVRESSLLVRGRLVDDEGVGPPIASKARTVGMVALTFGFAGADGDERQICLAHSPACCVAVDAGRVDDDECEASGSQPPNRLGDLPRLILIEYGRRLGTAGLIPACGRTLRVKVKDADLFPACSAATARLTARALLPVPPF